MREGTFFLLPPRPDLCQECAIKHEPCEPHSPQSLFYLIKFYRKSGRVPTWTDAMAHCDEEMKKAWSDALIQRGIKL
jgi:hypothetical protein